MKILELDVKHFKSIQKFEKDKGVVKDIFKESELPENKIWLHYKDKRWSVFKKHSSNKEVVIKNHKIKHTGLQYIDIGAFYTFIKDGYFVYAKYKQKELRVYFIGEIQVYFSGKMILKTQSLEKALEKYNSK